VKGETLVWYWIHPECLYNGYHVVPEKDKPIFYLDCKVPAELFFLGARAIGIERRQDGTVEILTGRTLYDRTIVEEYNGGVRAYAPPPHFHFTVAAFAAIGALFTAAEELGAESFYVQHPKYVYWQALYPVFIDRQLAAKLVVRRLPYALTPTGQFVEGNPYLMLIIYWTPYLPNLLPTVDPYLAQVGAYGPHSMEFKDMPIKVVFSQTVRRVVPLSKAPVSIQKIFGNIRSRRR